ncbi:MAG TPA: hypothetical protein VFS49_12665 [Croceibacterium sp.]|nr:hypothetical protein [Croceibacterium sp.]
MRTSAAALLALLLPTATQAGFAPAPMPANTGYRPGPINGSADARNAEYRREPGPDRNAERRRIRGELSLGDGYYQRQLARARNDIDRRRERGELTRSEARQLRREIGRIHATAQWYGRDGLSTTELGALDLRASELRSRIASGRPS